MGKLMNNSEVAVSIIVPTYNLENYIGDCINSILNQSMKNFELILVDDCSCDRTKEIIKEYIDSEESTNIILLENDQNMGAGYSRNRGLDIARGKYLLFLDGDDLFEYNMLEILYNVCEKTKADIVIYNSYTFDNCTNKMSTYNSALDMFIKKQESFHLSDIKDYAFQYIRETAWDKMFRRELIVKNEIRFQCQNNANDQFFVQAGLLKAERIVKIPNHLLRYRTNRQNQLSTSGSISRYPLCIWNATKATLGYIDRLGLYELYRKSFNIYVVTRLMFSLRKVDLITRRELLRFYQQKGFESLKLKNCSIEDFGVPYYFTLYKWLIQLESLEELEGTGRWILCNSGDKFEKLIEELKQEKKMVLWGAGKNGVIFLEKACNNKLDIRCVVDMNDNKVGETIQRYTVKHHNSVCEGDLIIATNPAHIPTIMRQMNQQKKKVNILDVRAYIRFDITFAQAKIEML